MNKNRLKKLNRFLRRLSADKWSYVTFHHQDECGTVCCAAGYCPVIFPNDWEYSTSPYSNIVSPALKIRDDYWKGAFSDLAIFFGMDNSTSIDIFQNCHKFYKTLRMGLVTPVHVANLIAYYMRYNKLPAEKSLTP